MIYTDDSMYYLPVRNQCLEKSFLGELQMEGVVTVSNEDVRELQ
jgi:hypothetical protein